MAMPVSPRTTAVGIQPPLGVAVEHVAVLVDDRDVRRVLGEPANRLGIRRRRAGVRTASAMSAIQYGQVFTFESNVSGSPAMNALDACFGSISAARSFAYAFDSSPFGRVCTNAGSA